MASVMDTWLDVEGMPRSAHICEWFFSIAAMDCATFSSSIFDCSFTGAPFNDIRL